MPNEETVHVWTVAPSLHLRYKFGVERGRRAETGEGGNDKHNVDQNQDEGATAWDLFETQPYLHTTLPSNLEPPASLIELWRQCESRIVSKDVAPETPELRPGQAAWEKKLSEFLDERADLKTPSKGVFKHVVVWKVLKHLLSFEQAWSGEGNEQTAVLRIDDMEHHKLSPVSDYPWFSSSAVFADFALGLHLTNAATTRMSNRSLASRTLNQTTSDSTRFFPIFASVVVHDALEVSPGQEQRRMFSWALAEFQKRRKEAFPLAFPHLTIEVHRDSWYLWVHVGQRQIEDEDVNKDGLGEDDVQIWSLGPTLLGSTRDEFSALVLMANLADVAGWGVKEYRAWFEECVLKAKIEY